MKSYQVFLSDSCKDSKNSMSNDFLNKNRWTLKIKINMRIALHEVLHEAKREESGDEVDWVPLRLTRMLPRVCRVQYTPTKWLRFMFSRSKNPKLFNVHVLYLIFLFCLLRVFQYIYLQIYLTLLLLLLSLFAFLIFYSK